VINERTCVKPAETARGANVDARQRSLLPKRSRTRTFPGRLAFEQRQNRREDEQVAYVALRRSRNEHFYAVTENHRSGLQEIDAELDDLSGEIMQRMLPGKGSLVILPIN